MRYIEDFKDYELIDAANGKKLERWGDIILIRPEPQAIWDNPKSHLWHKAHAIYHRSNSGGGYWEMLKKVPDVWCIKYKDLVFNIDNVKKFIDLSVKIIESEINKLDLNN